MDGDTIYEQTFNLEDYNINTKEYKIYQTAQMSYNSISTLFKQSTIQLWGQAEKAIQVALRYNINYKWYSYFLHPKSLNEQYQYGYWLQLYLFNDLLEYANNIQNEKLKRKLIKAYFSQDWEILL